MTMQNVKSFLEKYLVTVSLIIIIFSSFLLMLFSGRTDSLTTDEKVHISAGYLHTWKGNYLFNTEHPPLLNDIAGLFAKLAKPNLPARPLSSFQAGGDQWEYGDLFFYQSHNNVEKILFWARLPFIFLTLSLVYLVFLWARALFGPKAGLLAATLTAFSPNILAHGRLATTDIGVTFFFLLGLWCLRKYYFQPTWKNSLLLGLTLGLVVLSKFSALVILPLIVIGLLILWLVKRPPFRSSLNQLLIIILVPLVLIWGVYAFSMREYLFNLPPIYELSKTLGDKTLSATWSKWLIVPFDKFIQGLEIISDHNAGGHWSYLNGKVDYRGWWYYFPLAMWYKLTLTEMILLFGAAMAFFRGKIRQGFFDEFLLIFTTLFFLAISMVGKIDIGIRHILPILPLLYIFSSRLLASPNLILRKIVIILAMAQILIGVLAFPNYLAYFNQIAGGSKGGLKHLADSNLDWNQNMKRFGQYAKAKGIKKVYQLCWDSYSFDYYGVKNEILPNEPVNGIVVICAQQLVVPPEGFEISWVTKYPPDDIVSNGMYVWRFDKK